MLESFFNKSEKQFVSSDITQLYLELSTHCNFSCKTCVRHSIIDFKPQYFSLDSIPNLDKSISEIKSLKRIVLFGYGEALCNPYFKDLFSAIAKHGIPIVFITNGMLLNEDISEQIVKHISEIYISWDDPILQDDITKNHNIRKDANVELISANIHKLLEIKDKHSPDTKIGIEAVATKSNYNYLNEIISYWHKIGIDKFIITNLFPYTEEMEQEILYAQNKKDIINLKQIIKQKKRNIILPNQNADINRLCPFIERGTLFIKANGDISPCPELAYTHKAIYFGHKRTHFAHNHGNIANQSLMDIWNKPAFADFRNKFTYFDFQDCSTCYNPEMCAHRMSDKGDCSMSEAPCGECLWARNIILCP